MELPASMKAIIVENEGPNPNLVLGDVPVPVPAADQVLIKVDTAGVNRADVSQSMGRYPPPPGAPNILGMEASGTIVALGTEVREWRIGQDVCALIAGGGYAEYVAAPAVCVLPIPKNVSREDAGGLPEVYFTVWTNVFESARLQPGERFLVHGGSSGIGTAAIQLMHARGHDVYATAGSPQKCTACSALGAKRAINYREEDFVAVVMEETQGKGVDVILDMVGGDYVNRNLRTLSPRGRLANVAFMAGAKVEVDFRLVSQKRLTLMAGGLRIRSDEEKGHIRDAVLEHVWPLIEAGKIRPVTDSVLPLAEAAKAHARMRESQHIGKILLKI